ncbi:MAG: hypothetical protein ABL985_03940 [Casimicrobium sp.]
MNRPEPFDVNDPAPAKRVYERPTLSVFGPLAQLTQAGSTGVLEGAGMMSLMRMA